MAFFAAIKRNPIFGSSNEEEDKKNKRNKDRSRNRKRSSNRYRKHSKQRNASAPPPDESADVDAQSSSRSIGPVAPARSATPEHVKTPTPPVCRPPIDEPMGALYENYDIIQLMQDPEVSRAYIDIASNPDNASKYLHNAKVLRLVDLVFTRKQAIQQAQNQQQTGRKQTGGGCDLVASPVHSHL